MRTKELAIKGRGVLNAFAAALAALDQGDVELFKIQWANALRELDTFVDYKAGAGL